MSELINYGFFDADNMEMDDNKFKLQYRPRVEYLSEKLDIMYNFINSEKLPLVFTICCSGRRPSNGDLKDVLFIPKEQENNLWRTKVSDYKRFYLDKRTDYDPTLDIQCGKFDFFAENQNGQVLIGELGINNWIVFGNGLDFCVDNAIKSLIRSGCQVTFLDDIMVSSATGYGDSGTDISRRKSYENWVALGAKRSNLKDFINHYKNYGI